MVLLLFGPPGCGKGTQAAVLSERLQIPAISTGEVFRAECKTGTELGKIACEILARGGLVSDHIVNPIVARRIAREDCARGFLLDGYPRTVPQAVAFSTRLEERDMPDPLVIHLDVPADGLVARLTSRRQCPRCLRIYNRAGECAHDGAALVTREDDREEVIRQRLRAYDELTGPVLDWYGRSTVRTVDGTAAPEEVSCTIETLVRGASRRLAAHAV